MAIIKQPEIRAYDFKTIEDMVRDMWEKREAYKKTIHRFADKKNFYFVDGPPYTSGSIHMGTAWNKILKDFYIRYKRMHGYNIRDQAGYDMHGLPIEVKVEKTLGIKNKRDIVEKIGIDKFINKCREFALKYKDIMTEQFKALGVWLNWDNPYMTITNDYIESAWWTLKKGHEKGLLKQNERVLTWCPRCATALAEAEVEYWDEEDPSIYVKFRVKDTDNEYIIIWTTTPWTLPADLAVAVHPDFVYVRAKVRNKSTNTEEIWWLIESRLEEVAEKGGYEVVEIIEKKHGEDMEGMEYIHPLLEEVPYQQEPRSYWWHKVVVADYVTDDYTGCVHTAPGHGPDDFATGVRYELPPFCPVDEFGNFTSEAGIFAGKNTKAADPEIIEILRKKGILLHESKILHRYGHCWRCKSPITYRATKQWFLLVTELRDIMLKEIERVRWYPPWAGSSRFYDWVENTRDWCISRQRFWGIPMPIWRCGNCGVIEVIGSVKELEEKAISAFEKGMNLHRPWIDQVKLKCPECGGVMIRVEDVLDVWFDSAVCSWAQLNYPQKEDEFKRWWPMNWICEAHDQTRGWFYSQLGASVVAFGRCPYESVLVHGWALDAEGRAMSKSLGNIVDPLEVGKKYGFDAMRWYLLRASAPWEDLPFNLEGVRNAHRVMNILWNTLWFSTTYMALDNFDPSKYNMADYMGYMRPEDKWILSRINTVHRNFEGFMETFEIHKGMRELENFILEDLSRMYIKLVRDRTWTEEMTDDKIALYLVLNYVFNRLAKVLAPIVPFISEIIYQCFNRHYETVAMEDYPQWDEDLIDSELEVNMNIVDKIIEAGAYARQKAGIKLRWPLHQIIIESTDTKVINAVEGLKTIIKDQLNTKEVVIARPMEAVDIKLEARPVYSALGPVFKAEAKKVGELIANCEGQYLKESFDKEGKCHLDGYEITPDMVEFHEIIGEDWVYNEFEGGRIFVPKKIPEDLRVEGLAREVIRRVQEMRKDMDLHLEEFINIYLKGHETILNAVVKQKDYISRETRAKAIEFLDIDGEYKRDWDIEGMKITISISRTNYTHK